MDNAKRNVLILAACQTLYMSGTSLMITTSPLIGSMLAPDKGMATVPLALHHAGVMAATIPASHLMRAIGRRNGFMLATFFGMAGASIAGMAIMEAWFWVFCLGVFIIGWFNGFAVFYRFAAADASAPEFRPKAISWVLTGGLFAAILGPELAKHTVDLLSPILYAGSYFSLIGLYVLNLLLVSRVRIPPLTAAEKATSRPPVAADPETAEMHGRGLLRLCRLWRDEPADDVHASRDAGLRLHLRCLGNRHPVAHPGHVPAVLLHGQSGEEVRQHPHHPGRHCP